MLNFEFGQLSSKCFKLICPSRSLCSPSIKRSSSHNTIFSSPDIIAKYSALIILLILTLFHSTLAQVKSSQINDQQNPCVSRETCRDCISADPACAWCMQEGFGEKSNKRRCDFYTTLLNEGCEAPNIAFPQSSVNVTESREFSDQAPSPDSAVQLKPSRIAIKLRPKDTQRVYTEFKQAVDYPVDLYYLMDLSKSMEDDKEKLGLLGNDLAREMQRITRNFRLGFGSFVDKTVMPYISTVPEKIKQPCTGCVAPYGFRNHMAMASNSEYFVQKVKETNISGNLDAPEGGFDAIMQAIVCENEVGWRKDSRKLVVFSTDSSFHYAGDGKLGGIVDPNDGECHMDLNGEYTESTKQDYPSISQINQKAMDHYVNLIFAVTANQVQIYEKLSGLVKGSSTGMLANDSANIVELVKAEYQKITSSIELIDDYKGSDLKLEYYSKCLGDKLEKTNKCDGLRVGTEVKFEIRVTALKCPALPGDRNQTINISPVGLKESTQLDIQIICECDCGQEWNSERNSPRCSGGGTYTCGICECEGNRYGPHCECDAKSVDTIKDELACRYQNETRLCSGRGECICGSCKCNEPDDPNERIWGKHCECDNFSCLRNNGKVCSGHGTCDCGKCRCDEGWLGDDCNCQDSIDSCRAAPGDKICSGRGECVCNSCICGVSEDNQPYTGQYCQLCPTCRTQCEKLKDCVRCKVHQTGPLTDAECSLGTNVSKCQWSVIVVDDLEVDTERGEVHCVFIDEDDDCKYQFKYYIHGEEDYKKIDLTALRNKDCPAPVNVLAIVIGVIASIVLAGLGLLMIWKLLTSIHDRREFAKFEKERMMAKWDTGENPIFKQATTTFKNPTYGGKH
ncbi:integrin beta pat-3-like [Brevipalpus obovatus]|uniref:integrin beta pat-3-like n=1 Tax=Brevipalpus obovatus TaxID=246614 RepID=UPI003D9E840A